MGTLVQATLARTWAQATLARTWAQTTLAQAMLSHWHKEPAVVAHWRRTASASHQTQIRKNNIQAI
ncbi:hypothetical protein Lalb_Chr02g0154751 [Lupinus albus]|uniref:Uncharacterized protein n=1 Tax=Lupinus albus TaxID=3870 RepID=A0A6A4R0D9_LUPAL|nr:hypothetical protein Lalb_Chr02g0154751 [Lupinus albus]